MSAVISTVSRTAKDLVDEFGFERIDGLDESGSIELDDFLCALSKPGTTYLNGEMIPPAAAGAASSASDGPPLLVTPPQQPAEEDDDMHGDGSDRAKHARKGDGKGAVAVDPPLTMGSLRAELRAMNKEMVGLLTDTVKSQVAEVKTEFHKELTPLKKNVADIQAQQSLQNDINKELREELKAIKGISRVGMEPHSSNAGGACDARSDISGSTRFSFDRPVYPGMDRRASKFFVPSYLTLQGWTSGDPNNLSARTANIMTEDRGKFVVQVLWDSVLQGKFDRNIFDEKTTERDNGHKPYGLFRIKINFASNANGQLASKDTVWEVSRAIDKAIRDKDVALWAPEALGPVPAGSFVSVRVEVAPEREPQTKAGRKFVATFFKNKDPSKPNTLVRVENGPPHLSWAWGFQDRNNGKEKIAIGSWSLTEGWKLNTAAMTKFDATINVANWQTILNQTTF